MNLKRRAKNRNQTENWTGKGTKWTGKRKMNKERTQKRQKWTYCSFLSFAVYFCLISVLFLFFPAFSSVCLLLSFSCSFLCFSCSFLSYSCVYFCVFPVHFCVYVFSLFISVVFLFFPGLISVFFVWEQENNRNEHGKDINTKMNGETQ